jgi:hypothetical protein
LYCFKRNQVTLYTLFIIVGTLGNTLILWAVLGRESMRTARNVFIGTLAASDLFLCLFTMPSTLWEVIMFLSCCNFVTYMDSDLFLCLFTMPSTLWEVKVVILSLLLLLVRTYTSSCVFSRCRQLFGR